MQSTFMAIPGAADSVRRFDDSRNPGELVNKSVRTHFASAFVAAGVVAASAVGSSQSTGPSTLQSAYVLPSIPSVETTSVLSVGDSVLGYRMVGIPDGLGAFDNGDGTFTLLMNHELVNTAGVTRAHGAIGAFVSKW